MYYIAKILYLFISAVISILFYPASGHSEVFNVTNEDELREALSIAQSNGEDDVINIATGVYRTLGETFAYESYEDFSLTIEGEGAGRTILDGGEMNRVMEIYTISDVEIIISIKALTIQNGFHVSMPGDTPSGGAGISVVSLAEFADVSENVTIQDCKFINNKLAVSGCGGGLYASAPSLSMTNNVFNGNFAFDRGGGICVGFPINLERKNTLNLTNNTFTLNSSEGNGGGVYISYHSTCPRFQCVNGEINIYNNILYNNNAMEGRDIYIVYSFTKILPPPYSPDMTVGVKFDPLNLYNNDLSDFIYTAYDCDNINQDNILRQNFTYNCSFDINLGNNIDEDPLFVDAEAGDVNLQPDSPCIDAGDPNAPDVPNTDIRGNPRRPPPDMGAYEPWRGDHGGGNGGCSITHTPVTSSLAVFLAIPVLILIRRFVNRQRS